MIVHWDDWQQVLESMSTSDLLEFRRRIFREISRRKLALNPMGVHVERKLQELAEGAP